jgi:hypothetical protein
VFSVVRVKSTTNHFTEPRDIRDRAGIFHHGTQPSHISKIPKQLAIFSTTNNVHYFRQCWMISEQTPPPGKPRERSSYRKTPLRLLETRIRGKSPSCRMTSIATSLEGLISMDNRQLCTTSPRNLTLCKLLGPAPKYAMRPHPVSSVGVTDHILDVIGALFSKRVAFC